MMTPLEARLTEEVAALRAENKLLREKIDLLIRRIFGRSSEQLDDNQLMLLQGGDDGAKKTRPPAQAPAPWRLRSNSAAGTASRSKPARNVRHACRSICPLWMK